MLDALFKPKSVAVIGASTKELSIGNRIIKNLSDFGYKGLIYPVNPKADKVRDIKAYPSINDIPDEVELVHIVIPNKFVPQAVEDCGKKGVKFVIVNTAGFKEIGGEGIELEKMALEKAKQYGVRVFGPNCQGIINSDPEIRAYCNFTFTKPETGVISIVAQSGGVGEVVNQRFSELGVGVRMYASNGNASDVSIPEIIKYWGDDEQTKVIVVHIESLSDPREFMKVATQVASKKPVLGMKTGRTKEGAKAVSSHTGGLVKEDITTELIFEKCGIVTFRDEEELCQAAIAFASQPIPKGKRVGMITNTGGPAIIATDELVEAGLEIPPLSKETEDFLKGKLHPAASISNPIDVLATANAEHFRASIDALMNDNNIDSILINFVTPFFVDTDSIAKQIAEVNQHSTKPIICNLMTDKRQWTSTLSILREAGVPCYSFPETAAHALSKMVEYHELINRDPGTIKKFDDVDKEKVDKIIKDAKSSGAEFLPADITYELLSAYGIKASPWKVVKNSSEAVEAAKEIGFPVVVKVESKDVVHKSDAGGIALNLKTESEVNSAVEDIQTKFASKNPRFLIQKFVPGGKEIIMGAKSVENLGHVVMFGLGGIYVDVLKDVSFKINPISDREAFEMIHSIKGYPLLEGVRGELEVDIDGLIESLQRLSQLLADAPSIKELDLNPFMAFEKGKKGMVVDARIKI